MRTTKHTRSKIIRDILLVLVSIVVAIILLKTNSFDKLLNSTQEIKLFGNFLAGIFFTSLFSIAPASVALVKISHTTPALTVALFGGLGAMIGDLLLFLFLKNSLVEDITDMINRSRFHRFLSIFKFRIFRWLVPLMGALVIISPLPDELGLAMMGFSRISIAVLLPVSFILNFLGILLIISLAGTI